MAILFVGAEWHTQTFRNRKLDQDQIGSLSIYTIAYYGELHVIHAHG